MAELLAGARFDVEVSDRIQRDVWFKLWGNMTMNPLSAITGATSDRILDDDLVRAFASRCMLEAQAVGERIGLAVPSTPKSAMPVTRQLGAMRTSMLQDVDAGKPVELDALVAAVREIAQHLGLQTPSIDALLGLARLHARVRGLYPA
jgi:2-dehydropantoate 2-reductase